MQLNSSQAVIMQAADHMCATWAMHGLQNPATHENGIPWEDCRVQFTQHEDGSGGEYGHIENVGVWVTYIMTSSRRHGR
jgi:hypothetical protein